MNVDLSQAKRVYQALCAKRLEVIRAAWCELHCSTNRPVVLDRIRQEAHKIRGVAGTFGHYNLGNSCQDVEQLLSIEQNLGEVALQDFERVIQQLIIALEEVVAQSISPDVIPRMVRVDPKNV